MKLTREVKFALWLALAVVAAIAAFFAGGALKPQQEPHYVFDVDAPAYGSDAEVPLATSPGGFTGFQDIVPGGSRTVLGGRIAEIEGDRLTLETPAGVRTEMRLGPEPKLTRLDPGGPELLQPGASVLLRLGDTEDVAVAVLVLSAP